MAQDKALPFPEAVSVSVGWHLSVHTPPGTAAGAHPWLRPTDAHILLPIGSGARPALQTAVKRKQCYAMKRDLSFPRHNNKLPT